MDEYPNMEVLDFNTQSLNHFDLFKENPIAPTPDFFSNEQKNLLNDRRQIHTIRAYLDMNSKMDENNLVLEKLRRNIPDYQKKLLEKIERKFEEKFKAVDAYNESSEIQKNQIKQEISELKEKFVNRIAVSNMINEVRVQESKENLKFFLEEETKCGMGIETAMAMFPPEERNTIRAARKIAPLLLHDNYQENYDKNKKIVTGYLSENPEERKKFVLDVFNTVVAIPTNIFQFDGPQDFKAKYAQMFEISQKMLTYKSVMGKHSAESREALKIEAPALSTEAINKMEYFFKCSKLFVLYRNYLSSSADYGASDDLITAVKEKDGNIGRFQYKKHLLEACNKTDIVFGQTGYEERLERRTATHNKFISATKDYNDACKALRDLNGTGLTPERIFKKLNFINAEKLLFELGDICKNKYGYKVRLPERMNMELSDIEMEFLRIKTQHNPNEERLF